MALALKRITKELAKLNAEPCEGFTLLDTSNIMLWQGVIDGPKDTPYETGKFKIQITFNDEYPIKPPSLKFLQFIYHPNIYKDGKICIDILQGNEWSPAQNVQSIIQSLRSLFMDPNPSSPANREAANLYITNRDLYNKTVKQYLI